MLFREGGIPRVVTFGGQRTHQRTAYVPYADDPGTGWRWVAMDTEFQNDFVPAMAQQNVHVVWAEEPTYLEALRDLAGLVGLDLGLGTTHIIRAAVQRLQES